MLLWVQLECSSVCMKTQPEEAVPESLATVVHSAWVLWFMWFNLNAKKRPWPDTRK